MTRQPMRVPGFPPPAETSATDPNDGSPAPAPTPAPRSPKRPAAAAGAPPLDPRRGARQLNSRISLGVLHRYHRLLRELEDEGYATTMTELVHALLHAGPTTTTDARTLIRAWRRAVDPDR